MTPQPIPSNLLASSSLLEILKEDGVFVVRHFLPEVQNLSKEVLNLIDERGSDYNFGRAYRGDNLSSYSASHPNLFQAFSSPWMRELNTSYKNQGYAKKIFASLDNISTSVYAKNGWLHFDKDNCLKFLIYLTDIDSSNGAFTCSPGSVKHGRILREGMKDYAAKRQLENSFPEVVKQYPPYPIYGEAGTLIVFDTDTFHFGGRVKAGHERVVVRAHCY